MSAWKCLLAPTDFSEVATHALDYAFALAEALEAKVHIVHAYLMPIYPDDAGVANLSADELFHEAQDMLKRLEQSRRASPALGGAQLKLGDARDVIVSTAEELKADMIVMETHARHGLARALLGSVTEGVMRRAPCPVLGVRPAIHDLAGA